MNNPMYFELQADDLPRAREFYESVFGWKFTEQPGLSQPYFRIETAGLAGGLLQRPARSPGPSHSTNAALISMEVEDFDTAAKKIVEEGGIETMAKFAVPGRCWQGYFLDTEGNMFGVFEADEDAA